jgi:O-antigen/teichoic acid export membrane protein
VIAGGALSLLGFVLAPWIAEAIFDKPALGEPMQWMCLSILPFAVINLQAESLKGLKLIGDAVFLQNVGIPLIGLLLIWPLYQWSGVEGATLAYLLATVVVTGVGAVTWKRGLSGFGGVRFYPASRIWASCRSLFVASLVSRGVLPWAPFLLLGIWASSEEVGIFGVANRVVLLVGFLLGAVNAVLSPKFAELYVKKDVFALEKTSKRVALVTTILASPLLITLIMGGEWILGLFGREFSSGSTVLAILALGQYVNIFCGSIGQLLVMSGNEADVARGMILLAIVLILTCVLLMPGYGMVGGAVATSLSLTVWNIWMAVVVRKRLGFTPVPI